MSQNALCSRLAARAALVALLLASPGCGSREGEAIGSLAQAYRHPPPSTAPPWTYMLTSYNDYTTPACGGKKIDGTWWYSTGAYGFGCGAKLELRANGKCAIVSVVDDGPAEWVEAQAKAKCGGTGYIIDASPLVSEELFGESSAGWSDCYAIEVREVPEATPDGPCAPGATPAPVPTPAPQCPALEPAGGVISEDGPCIELHGADKFWRAVSGEGHDNALLWTNAFESSSPVNWASWKVELQQAGEYLVEYHAAPQYAVHRATRYRLRHEGQEHEAIVDQSAAQPGWNAIATLRFAAGGDQWVAVYDSYDFAVPADQHIVVDALRLTRLDATPTPLDGPPRPGDDITDAPAPAPPATPPPASSADPAPAAADPSSVWPQPAPAPRVPPEAGCAVARAWPAAGSWWLVALALALAALHARRWRTRR